MKTEVLSNYRDWTLYRMFCGIGYIGMDSVISMTDTADMDSIDIDNAFESLVDVVTNEIMYRSLDGITSKVKRRMVKSALLEHREMIEHLFKDIKNVHLLIEEYEALQRPPLIEVTLLKDGVESNDIIEIRFYEDGTLTAYGDGIIIDDYILFDKDLQWHIDYLHRYVTQEYERFGYKILNKA